MIYFQLVSMQFNKEGVFTCQSVMMRASPGDNEKSETTDYTDYTDWQIGVLGGWGSGWLPFGHFLNTFGKKFSTSTLTSTYFLSVP
jgi:hypothetical protein